VAVVEIPQGKTTGRLSARAQRKNAKRLMTTALVALQPIGWPVSADWAIVALFVLVSSAFTMLALSAPTPHVLSFSDPGLVASIVAGWLYPERFLSDPILSDRTHYSFYITALIPLVMLIQKVVRDIGTAYVLTLFPILLLQLIGFYQLGRFLFGRRLPALMLALISIPPVFIFDGGEFWGTVDEPHTRMMYNAALPFLLLLFMRHGAKLAAPLFLFALCGLCVYLHPVSAPTVALALWLGCFALQPRSLPIWLRIRSMFAGGLAFLLIALPFMILFLSSFQSLSQTGQDTGAWALINATNSENSWRPYMDALYALKEFVHGHGEVDPGWGWQWLVWAGGLAGYCIVPVLRPDQWRPCAFFLLVFAGILIGSVGVSWIDQQLFLPRGRMPAEIEIIRNLRFLVPLLLIGAVWLIISSGEALARQFDGSWRKATTVATTVLLAILVVSWWAKHPTGLWDAAARLIGGEVLTRSQREIDQVTVLRYLKSIDSGSVTMVLGDESLGLAVRYGALQPASFLVKDVNLLLGSGPAHSSDWLEHHSRMMRFGAAQSESEAAAALGRLISLARPRYLLLDRERMSSVVGEATLLAGELVLDTPSFALIKVAPSAKADP
jgi:hypothetical protein